MTGEGRLDHTSLTGKVVGGVIRHARQHDVPVLAVVGQADAGLDLGPAVTVVDLSARYGSVQARSRTAECVRVAVLEHLTAGMEQP